MAFVLACAAVVATFLVDPTAAGIALVLYAVAVGYFAFYSRHHLLAAAPEENSRRSPRPGRNWSASRTRCPGPRSGAPKLDRVDNPPPEALVMHLPLIGISTYLESDARWGVWQHRAAVLPAGYHGLVQRAGGWAALLPPDAPERAEEVVARLDGLVVSGGPDVEPVRYGAAPEPECGPPAPERDAWELALTEAALRRRVPLLGICRGMQVLNVVCGGTLIQHLEGHRGEPGVFAEHPVQPVAGTRLARALPAPVTVPTYHHQAVAQLGDCLVPSAYAADGTVEAVELPAAEHPFALAVQWHPEEGDDTRVMRALVDAASAPSSVDALAP